MAITGRVPLLLLLGLVAVVLRPSVGTMWLWVLVVLLLVGLDVALAPSPGRITVERLPVDRVRAGLESAEHAGRRQRRHAPYGGARPRRLAADRRRDAGTVTGSGSPPATAPW